VIGKLMKEELIEKQLGKFLNLKIIDSEDIEGLDRVLRRFRALLYWTFERY
jgi:hypothetical protein